MPHLQKEICRPNWLTHLALLWFHPQDKPLDMFPKPEPSSVGKPSVLCGAEGTYWAWGLGTGPTLEVLQEGHHFQVPGCFCLWEGACDQQPGP